MKFNIVFTLLSIIVLTSCQIKESGLEQDNIKEFDNNKELIKSDVNVEEEIDNQIIQEIKTKYSKINDITHDHNSLFISIEKNNQVQLIEYDIPTGNETVLFTSEYPEGNIQDLQANDSWVVWTNSTMDSLVVKIYSLNRSTNEINKISESTPDNFTADSPSLYNNFVAWVYLESESDNPTPVIKLHDLNKKQTEIISEIENYGLYNNWVHISEGKLLWTDSILDKGYYFIYDLRNKEINRYESPYIYPGYAMISDNKIFAIHFNDFRRWSTNEFGYYDINNNKYVKFFEKNTYINRFRVSNNGLSIIDKNGKLSIYQLNNSTIIEQEIAHTIISPNNLKYATNGELLFTYPDDQGKEKIIIIN